MSHLRFQVLLAAVLPVLAATTAPAARAVPMIFDVDENTTENGVTPATLGFGGGVNGTYTTADSGPCDRHGDSFTLTDNGNGTSTISNFCSDPPDNDPLSDVERVNVRNANNRIVAVIRITSPPEGRGTVPEPSTWTMMLIGFAGLGFAGYRTSRRAAAVGLRP